MRFVVITGCPRSGTSVFKKVLRQHPQLRACGTEHGYLLDALDRFGAEVADASEVLDFVRRHRWSLGDATHDSIDDRWEMPPGAVSTGAVLREMLRLAARADEGDQIVLQFPGPGLLRFEDVRFLLGDVVFVVTTRDPRANVSSQLVSFGPRRSLVRSVRLWKQCVAADRELADVGGPRVGVSYERLVSEPDDVLDHVSERLGLARSAGLAQSTVTMPVVATSGEVAHRDFRGFDTEMLEKWRTGLSDGQIWIVDALTARERRDLDYPDSGQPFRLWFAVSVCVEFVRYTDERIRAFVNRRGTTADAATR